VPIYNVQARDTTGRFVAKVADADSIDSHLLRLNRGDSVWEDLGTLADAFDFIEVRKDGLALDFSSGVSRGAWLYEFYGTGDSDLLPDPKEDGVKFTPAAVTLHPGQSIKVGLALGGASSLDGLSIAPGPGTRAMPKVTLSPHGAAGYLVVSAEETAAAGATQITLKSPNGTAASAISFSTPINQTQYAHFDALIALRSDGTAWDASVCYENSDPFPVRTPRQLDTPTHVVGVGTSGYSMAILTADGNVYQAPLSLGFLQSSGANTAFIKIPALDSVLLPPSAAPQPDFDVSGPALSTINSGASIDVPLTVSRSGGFTGDITVTGQNPPAGLTVAPLTIPASATTATLHITAAPTLTRFSRLALQLVLTSGSASHIAQILLSTPITGGMSHPTFTIGGTHGSRSVPRLLAW
jgi:hypothetical protein